MQLTKKQAEKLKKLNIVKATRDSSVNLNLNMPKRVGMQKTIDVPISLIGKISKAAKAFEDLEDEMEDFLLSKDPAFLEKMQRARKDHLSGKTRSLKNLKKELCTR